MTGWPMYGTTDAGPRDLAVAAFARGQGGQLSAVKAWPLKPASFSLERFTI